MSVAEERDADGIDDELSRALNARQSRKIRRAPRRSESRVLVADRPEGVVRVYASGLRDDPLWGVWTRRGTYCDDRALPVGVLSTLLLRDDVTVVDVDDVSDSILSVFNRGGHS